MNPVAIFRHAAFEGPGYLAGFLDARKIPWQLIAIDAGEAVPTDVSGYSGLVFMGGPMSVNDDLPWIAEELNLIREAVASNVPVLGHCLGAQLMSKALGGEVSKNPVKEIGWGEVAVADGEAARRWFGKVKRFDAFHWHGETFTLPPGAVHLLSGEYCRNQGYAIGSHLALQCHIEMTGEMVDDWSDAGEAEIKASLSSPAVQSAKIMRQQASLKLPQLNHVAEQLYTQWISGLRG
ncbi:MAG: type 1 glutamine amidotransferase [Gallionella sp.]|nr:type 1 glutamine amidotransferase [Gallionella sp.]